MMSVQQMIDCNASNYGCWGGNKLKAYDYVIQMEV
ncbi:Granulin repeat cysteine protease family protein [Prunus dulcis]|uniref:Granulin repeat cysteine protease family protein n=1 Tax=Prunus dulcis TaxID=3755 RepID=A0A4Y1RGC0_PRUDU|nr:Granulin repeat cysteine protease family protein [Prunus dulcis]